MPAKHPHDKTTLSLVRLILNVALAAFDSCFFVSHVAQATLEDREKGLLEISRTIKDMSR